MSNRLPPETVPEGGFEADEAQYSSIVHANTAQPRRVGDLTQTPSLQRPMTSLANASRNRRGSQSSSASRASRFAATKATLDPELDINLPYRTLSATANLDEYRIEVPGGEISGPEEPAEFAAEAERASLAAGRAPTNQSRHYRLVTFEPDDPGNPKNWSKAFKWYITMVVAVTCFVVAFASSVVTADVTGVMEEFDVSEEVVLLTITLFVIGFGVGPMVFAPLSEVYGRKII